MGKMTLEVCDQCMNPVARNKKAVPHSPAVLVYRPHTDGATPDGEEAPEPEELIFDKAACLRKYTVEREKAWRAANPPKQTAPKKAQKAR